MSSLPFSAFTADGFRGLRSLEVSELRGINVFVGGNNSGKTSVLEVLALLSNPTNSYEWIQAIRRRDYGRLDESIVQSLRWCFGAPHGWSETHGEEAPLNLVSCFTADGATPIREMISRYHERPATLTNSQIEEISRLHPGVDTTQFLSAVVDSKFRWSAETLASSPSAIGHAPPESSGLLLNDFSEEFRRRSGPPTTQKSTYGCGYAALLPYSYQLNTLQVGARSSQLFVEEGPLLLLELMREFDQDVQNVEVASFAGLRPAIYIKHRGLGVVPLSAFGDAMRRCLLLATTLTSLSPGSALLLDEVEVGIHIESLPKVFKWLAKVARQLGVQVFATTHSLDALDALLAAEVDEHDLSAYRLKQGNERTECQHFPFDSLKRIRYERGLDIR
ncbi:ATP-binding protein [Roseateles chitinivorans]|uniref:ATP-binding protein n=1 Tax=Roseateles chitinivorans TaxID=2917965 RepID=UPI003D671EB9